MMTAEQFHGRAREAARFAALAPDQRLRNYWLGQERDWEFLALGAYDTQGFQFRPPVR